MNDDVQQRMTERMKKSIEALKHEFAKIRTGRAHPSLLEHVHVNYYGNEGPCPKPPMSRSRTLGPWP